MENAAGLMNGTVNGSQPPSSVIFDEQDVIKKLKRYLPAQAPLKDFIFQNNLESFQEYNFFKGLSKASEIFGYKVFLSLKEFRSFYEAGRIREDILDKIIADHKGKENVSEWKDKLITKHYDKSKPPRIGQLRSNWKKKFGANLDSIVHPTLFRILCCYLDQGISIWNFPIWQQGFILSVKEMERNSFTSFFKTQRPRKLLLEGNYEIDYLLSILVGDPAYYKQYLFDQQFGHQGWSGMVSVVESNPDTFMDKKKISMKDLIALELLLEIDAIDLQLGTNWKPLNTKLTEPPLDLFAEVEETELQEVYQMWQEAFEWTSYDEAIAGLQLKKDKKPSEEKKSFQAFFCIDDREISLRDHLERADPNCETFGTPGFFNIEFYFQPEHGKALTKLCPAPVTPKYLIKELTSKEKREKDVHFAKNTHSMFTGALISQTLGFWSAIKLAVNIFRPSMSPATASSFRHMHKVSSLSILHDPKDPTEFGLQKGFTLEEMATRVEGLLRSVGLLNNFAPLIYMVGHGASSVNNPFFATMDCGACSCRPGSVNARAFCYMANHPEVRAILAKNGIDIPATTRFEGGIHDTTRDEIMFYDEDFLSPEFKVLHDKNMELFQDVLSQNAKERSRRFESINSKQHARIIHEQIKTRSVSLFEPRPELDHATNAFTIIGRRRLTKGLFLDRRSFLNSYDYTTDPEGKLLNGIMRPIAPVCGGINLSYYFSRVDNQKLGAGTKLPHNVMGLFGVANGIDGDLRPGLPSQMIESHDPVRHLVIVEHYPEVVLSVLKGLPTYEWYYNNWMSIMAMNPETKEFYLFKEGEFKPYTPLTKEIPTVSDLDTLLEESHSMKNIPVHIISQA